MIKKDILSALFDVAPRQVIRIYNISLDEARFRSRCKEEKVIPLHQGGNKPPDYPSSCRPITHSGKGNGEINSGKKLCENDTFI